MNLSLVLVAFRVPKGTEAAVYTVRHYLKSLRLGEAILKLDFKNALNTPSRGAICYKQYSMSNYSFIRLLTYIMHLLRMSFVWRRRHLILRVMVFSKEICWDLYYFA